MPDRERPVPVDPETFSARLNALAAPRRFALAVSGGRDSMALARLAAAYCKMSGAEAFAFTVDHGLRPEAAAEAAQCAAWCEAAGLPARVLTWDGDKPATGLQAAARAARYRLLAHAAEEAGCAALLTAHSADDQAETVFMRLKRGAGVRGLAAIDAETVIAAGAGAPVRLLRPLLSFSRAALTASVEAMGQDYIDDPSNDDPAFERVRTRALLAALEAQDLMTGAALRQTADRMRAADRRLRAQEAALFRALGGCFYSWGGVSIDRFEPDAAPEAGLAGLGARLIHAASGEAHGANDQAALQAVRAAARDGAATLAGTLVRRWRGRLWFLREPGAVLGRTGVAPMAPEALDAPLLWDGRFILRPRRAGLSVAPAGESARGLLGPAAALFEGPPEALFTMPGVYRDGALIGAPALPSTGFDAANAEPLAEERFSGGIIRF